MYTNKTLVEAFIKRELSVDENTLFNGYNSAVERYINEFVNGSFGSVVSSTKYYEGGSNIVNIDACQSVTAVNHVDTDETVLYEYDIDEDLELMPRNDTVKRWIERRSGVFPRGVGCIAVTAQFTLGTVPEDIQYVATVMVGSLLVEGFRGKLTSEGIEGYNRAFAVSLEKGELSSKKEVIDAILGQYIKVEGVMI